ncbi:hypothetical protein WJX84_000945 [Apatococcus fuscideae]|uniref:Uncharacterized protein n=1 Tax=Apatococcus fuscideae TaxID=2026836 RepID=A0AAW1SUT7_9CHLO
MVQAVSLRAAVFWPLLISAALALDPAIFTKEAELVPGSIGPGLDCWDLLPLLLGTDCTWPSVTEQEVVVTLCVTSSDSGALVITSPAPFSGQDVYRARLVGQEIQLLEVHYCSRQLAIAPYRTTTTGAVHAEVLHLHSNFTYHNPTPVNDVPALLASDYDFETQSPVPFKCTGGPCPLCESLHNPGRWMFNGMQPALQRTCIFPRYFSGCHGIPIFDTWSMTAPVFDLSYDGAHYKGDIGYEIGLALLNYLCKNHRI